MNYEKAELTVMLFDVWGKTVKELGIGDKITYHEYATIIGNIDTAVEKFIDDILKQIKKEREDAAWDRSR